MRTTRGFSGTRQLVCIPEVACLEIDVQDPNAEYSTIYDTNKTSFKTIDACASGPR